MQIWTKYIGEKSIKNVVIKCVNSKKAKENVTESYDILKSISQNAVIPAHFNLSYGENSGGIHTATPPRIPHVLCKNGLFKYLLRNLYNSVKIPERFKKYWKMVERGRCSYNDLNQKYPKPLDASEIKQHNFDSTEYERRAWVLVLAAKWQSDCSIVKCSSSLMV